MTEEQKLYIEKARNNGSDYMTIAQKLGVSASAVKVFCSRNHLSDKYLRSGRIQTDPGLCRNCGKPIASLPGRKRRIFCSRECGLAWWHKNPEHIAKKAVYTIVCLNCGTSFSVYGQKGRKFCSTSCFAQYRRKAK